MAALKDIVVPELGMTAEEVTVDRWCKEVGEAVVRGEPLVELTTDKATVELEATDDGILVETIAGPDETVAVGAAIGRLQIGAAADVIPPRPADGPAASPSPTPPAPAAAIPAAPTPSAERPRATPVARRMARDSGLDLGDIEGSGPGGRIRRADVEKAIGTAAGDAGVPGSARPPRPHGGRGARRVRLSRAQRRLAAHLVGNAVPQFSVAREVDVTAALAVPSESGGPTFSDVLVKAVAMTIRHHELLNATYEGDELAVWDAVNVGVAIAVGADLFVPVVRDAEALALRELSAARRSLFAKAREGGLRPADTADATVVISNMGALGVTEVEPVVSPPQVCLLGVGAPTARLVPTAGGGSEVRRLMSVRATCDHRAVNGATAAAFLADLAARLSNPFSLGEV